MSWASERARFPVLERYAYLNTGSFGPLARETLQAMADVREREAVRGRSGRRFSDEVWERRGRVRRLVAEQIGVPAEHLALADSTTQAVQVVVLGLGLGPGEEVATTDAEHGGLAGPLIASGATLQVAAVRGRAPGEILDAVLAAVTPRTRLLALSAVSWLDGAVLPWRELRDATGLPVLVDGAQAAGAVEVDARDADFFTVSAQKWLCGPAATGALYVREPDRLPARLVGYAAMEAFDSSAGTWAPRAGAARLDPSFTPAASLAGLEAALSHLQAGRFARSRMLTERCRTLLLDAGVDVVTAAGQATLVAFRVPGDAAETSAQLHDRGVIVRDLPGTDLVRASVGWWNDETDLERLVAALREAQVR